MIDASVFRQPIDEETLSINAEIIRKLSDLPDMWQFPPAVVRQARASGQSALPPEPAAPRAEEIAIESPRGPVTIRIIPPDGEARGGYLHLHGGGWMYGSARFQDQTLTRFANETGLLVASVEYRLAPEDPWPAGPDDCEAAARWFTGPGAAHYGLSWFAIGGESAGANLSAVTLLRLARRPAAAVFSAANLVAGGFDLGLTPSARTFPEQKLVLGTRDIEMFARNYLVRGGSVTDPDVSPLYGDLAGMPPALFSVGTLDPLLDDSLFMAARWWAAGSTAELAVYPGGAHVFQAFGGRLAEESNARMVAFLNERIAAA